MLHREPAHRVVVLHDRVDGQTRIMRADGHDRKAAHAHLFDGFLHHIAEQQNAARGIVRNLTGKCIRVLMHALFVQNNQIVSVRQCTSRYHLIEPHIKVAVLQVAARSDENQILLPRRCVFLFKIPHLIGSALNALAGLFTDAGHAAQGKRHGIGRNTAARCNLF